MVNLTMSILKSSVIQDFAKTDAEIDREAACLRHVQQLLPLRLQTFKICLHDHRTNRAFLCTSARRCILTQLLYDLSYV